jgi:hypothetical protein
MMGLTTPVFSQACRIFLTLAYPDGNHTIPPAKTVYSRIEDSQNLESLLEPPVCQKLTSPEGRVRGFALRLGSSHYPHLKLQVIDCDYTGTWVFGVDTHDGIRLDPGHPDAERLARLQSANQRLKEQIERAWEAEGLLTFAALLRRGLESAASNCPPAPYS